MQKNIDFFSAKNTAKMSWFLLPKWLEKTLAQYLVYMRQ